MWIVRGKVNDVGGSLVNLDSTPRELETARNIAVSNFCNSSPELLSVYLVEVDGEKEIVNNGFLNIIDIW